MSSIASPLWLLLFVVVASTPGAPGVVTRMAAAFQSPVPVVTVTRLRHLRLHHWRRQHSSVVTTTTATAGIRRLTPSSSLLPSSSTMLYSSLTNRPTELPDSLVDAAAMAANVSNNLCVCFFVMIREAGVYIMSQ